MGSAPWLFRLANGSNFILHTAFFKIVSHIALNEALHTPYGSFLVPDFWLQKQPLPPNAVQVDKTVAEPESLKKLLITWLMCTRLWEWEINHQPQDELLKWSLVFCLLSLGNGFSFLHHQVNRCRAAVLSALSQEQPVARPCLSSVLLHEQFIAHRATYSECFIHGDAPTWQGLLPPSQLSRWDLHPCSLHTLTQ